MASGYVVKESLHLLARDLTDIPKVPRSPLRRGRKRERTDILAVDRAAFGSFWQLDEAGLHDALHATPSARLRVATDSGSIVGYAVSGRAGGVGYLQRLAMHPDQQGRGWGYALVLDGLRWMGRRGARRALVNTQHENDRALGLYRRLGFVDQPQGLAVLVRRLDVP